MAGCGTGSAHSSASCSVLLQPCATIYHRSSCVRPNGLLAPAGLQCMQLQTHTTGTGYPATVGQMLLGKQLSSAAAEKPG